MKRNFYFFLILFIASIHLNGQLSVFEDDFESGLINWTVTGLWALTTDEAVSPANSLTDSPGGNYPDVFTSEATMSVSADLSFALDADVKFYANVDLEEGFDYVYLDASSDAGATWINIYTFNGEDGLGWQFFEVPLGAFVGGSDVRLRFRFFSDAAYNVDGIYIDDLIIYTYNVDESPPLILHTPTTLYEGTLGPNPIDADLIDPSGIANTFLWYSVDGAAYTSIVGVPTAGDNYLYEIPELAPGTFVSYFIEATDDFGAGPNTAISDTFDYVSGNYISYDDGSIDFVADIGTTSLTGYVSAAVKITLTGETDVVTAIIQNYTDYMRPNDDIQFHVWEDDGTGLPGDDLITPFYLTPEPTLEEPNRGTRVDLRGTVELEGIVGDVYIGYTVPGGVAWLSYSNTLVLDRSYVQTGFGWSEFTGDFHFRVVTSAILGAPEALYSYIAAEPTVTFTDLSTNSPTSWYWDFGDATSDIIENPVHTFMSNGDFNVCLTATNGVASDTYCEIININSYVAPVTNFLNSGDPLVTFTDLTLNDPTSWFWDFDDATTSTLQNPVHTFLVDGTYNVCLTSTNPAGSSTFCKDVVIANTPKVPVVDFTWSISGTTVSFTDLSTNTPDYWNWDFGDLGSSTLQNPSHFYAAPSSFTVCLTAGNVAGEGTFCEVVSFNGIEDNLEAEINIYPNPANNYLQLEISNDKNYYAEIINVVGETVLNFVINSNKTIDISQFSSGFYLIKISDDNNTGIRSFIKE